MDGTRGSGQALDAAGHGDGLRGPHSVYRISWASFVLPSPNPCLFLMFFLLKQTHSQLFFFLTYPEWILVCEAVASEYMVLEMVLWSFIYIIFIYLFGWVFDAVGAFL